MNFIWKDAPAIASAVGSFAIYAFLERSSLDGWWQQIPWLYIAIASAIFWLGSNYAELWNSDSNLRRTFGKFLRPLDVVYGKGEQYQFCPRNAGSTQKDLLRVEIVPRKRLPACVAEITKVFTNREGEWRKVDYGHGFPLSIAKIGFQNVDISSETLLAILEIEPGTGTARIHSATGYSEYNGEIENGVWIFEAVLSYNKNKRIKFWLRLFYFGSIESAVVCVHFTCPKEINSI